MLQLLALKYFDGRLYMQIASRCNVRGILALDSFGNSSSPFLVRREVFATLLSARYANSKMFIDKAYTSKCCRATDIYQVKVVEEMRAATNLRSQ